MTQQTLMNHISKKIPEIKKLSSKDKRLIQRVVEEAVRFVQNEDSETLSPSQTHSFMKKLVSDSGSPAQMLRAYRKRQSLTQAELSEKCGISQAHISEMENGRRTIGLNSAKKLAKILKCDYKRLI